MRTGLLLLLLLLLSCSNQYSSSGTNGGGSEIIVWVEDSVIYGKLLNIKEEVTLSVYSAEYISDEFTDSSFFSKKEVIKKGDTLFTLHAPKEEACNLFVEGSETGTVAYFHALKVDNKGSDSLSDTLGELHTVSGEVDLTNSKAPYHTIVCKGTPYEANIAMDGSFSFDGLPAGQYEMILVAAMWDGEKGESIISVTESDSTVDEITINKDNTNLQLKIKRSN